MIYRERCFWVCGRLSTELFHKWPNVFYIHLDKWRRWLHGCWFQYCHQISIATERIWFVLKNDERDKTANNDVAEWMELSSRLSWPVNSQLDAQQHSQRAFAADAIVYVYNFFV